MATAALPKQASNADLVRWAVERTNDHDVESLKLFWAKDAVERFPDRTCQGAEEIAAYFENLFRAIPDWSLEIVGIAAQGEDVFIQWQATGTHKGRLMGIEPTGKRIAIDGIDHFIVRDGRMVSNFIVVDQMEYARQLGMIPPDGSAADKGMKSAFNLRTKLARGLRR